MNKRVINAGKKLFLDGSYRFRILSSLGFFNWIDDERYIKKQYSAIIGKPLDLDNPKSFSEKLQWLKLYDHNPQYTIMADKYRVREYVSNIIGSDYLIPILGVWNRARDINFDQLPQAFVLKCNHNSGGGMCICKDKSRLDVDEVVIGLERELSRNYYWPFREWAYKDIKPRVIAEQYMEDKETKNIVNTLINYKFYCFNGEPRFLYVGTDDVSSGKKGELRLTFYDLEMRRVPFYRSDHKELSFDVQKPDCFDEMIRIARLLSKDIPFVRVDLYCINDKVYFSELTFYPGGGVSPFEPQEWENKMGDWIVLPNR